MKKACKTVIQKFKKDEHFHPSKEDYIFSEKSLKYTSSECKNTIKICKWKTLSHLQKGAAECC